MLFIFFCFLKELINIAQKFLLTIEYFLKKAKILGNNLGICILVINESKIIEK